MVLSVRFESLYISYRGIHAGVVVYIFAYLHTALFPASRGSFHGVHLREKRDLCHGSKMTTLSMLLACERRRISDCRLSPEIHLRSQASMLPT